MGGRLPPFGGRWEQIKGFGGPDCAVLGVEFCKDGMCAGLEQKRDGILGRSCRVWAGPWGSYPPRDFLDTLSWLALDEV